MIRKYKFYRCQSIEIKCLNKQQKYYFNILHTVMILSLNTAFNKNIVTLNV